MGQSLETYAKGVTDFVLMSQSYAKFVEKKVNPFY